MPKISRPLVIGITGGIGSGKSTFSSLLTPYHYPLINADKIGHDVLNTPLVQSKLIAKFGVQIIDNEQVNRVALGKFIFSDDTARTWLNKLVHPLIREKMQSALSTCTTKYIFYEVPLLFENTMQACFDYIILITAPLHIRICRLQARDHINIADIQKKIASQLADADKISLADYVVNNDSNPQELAGKLSIIFNKLENTHPKNIIPFNKLAEQK